MWWLVMTSKLMTNHDWLDPALWALIHEKNRDEFRQKCQKSEINLENMRWITKMWDDLEKKSYFFEIHLENARIFSTCFFANQGPDLDQNSKDQITLSFDLWSRSKFQIMIYAIFDFSISDMFELNNYYKIMPINVSNLFSEQNFRKL